MLDSGTKPPENRIHLFDPVGLINDGYGGGGGYMSSSYGGVRGRRPTKSYGNFEEVNSNNNNNNGVGLRTYDSVVDHTNNNNTTTNNNINGGLRSYNSFTMETNGVGIISFDNSVHNHDHNHDDNRISSNHNNDINNNINNNDNDDGGLELRFGVDNKNNVVGEAEDSDVSTPRLWKTAPTSPAALNNNNNSNNKSSDMGQQLSHQVAVVHHRDPVSSYNFHPITSPNSPLNSVNSSPLHPKNSSVSVSLSSSPVHPASVVKSANSSSPPPPPRHAASVVKAVNNASSHLSANSSPLYPSSPKQMYQQNLSPPSSRTQAIAKGRRELMDMVRDLPESFYELSLKDIVDQKAEMEVQKEVVVIPVTAETTGKTGSVQEKKKVKKSGKKVKKSESKKKMVRSKSVDNGRFLLRTSVFPIFSGSKKNKKALAGSSSFKVAPMPKPQPSSSVSMKAASEKDWWRRKSCISSESDHSNGLSSKSASSDSSSSSSLSISSNGRRSNRFLPTCCLFNGRRIRSKK